MNILVRFRALLLGVSIAWMAATTYADDFRIGVYYFPGWKAGQMGNARELPWAPIKPYTEREPVLGWYSEDAPGVLSQQLQWMRDYGLDFVVFDWLWGRTDRPFLNHAVDAYLSGKSKQDIDFAILWANHTEYVFSAAQFDTLFRYWAQRYFSRPAYLKIDGKPAVFIFSAEKLNENARKIGLTPAKLIARADEIAREFGLSGVNFIGGVGANNGRGFDYSTASGYAGFSAYNFHGMATHSYEPGRTMSHSYAELDTGYRNHWAWMMTNAEGLYVVPMTSGWDKRPWGGSKDPGHDNSRSTPLEFDRHLRASRKFMTENPGRTKGIGVICCWNEFGEGSFIEPTREQGFAYLDMVRRVFGATGQ